MRTAIDVDQLKSETDLLALIEQDLGRRARRAGGWYMVPCPFHGDWTGDGGSLGIRPDSGFFKCFGCDAKGDAVEWVMRRESLSFPEACERLGARDLKPLTPRPPVLRVEPTSAPTPEWREAAGEIVTQCEAMLFSDAGARAREALAKRGIDEWTASHWRLGYNLTAERRWREDWGDWEYGCKIVGYWVPRGIVIPWYAGGELWQVKIRRPTDKPERRYASVPGGHPLLFGVDELKACRAAILTEGELDAVLLWQEAGDLAGVATLGSAGKSLTDEALRYLIPVGWWLVAYDVDVAGEEAARKLLSLSARVRRVRVPKGKDLTEYWLAGGNLREWVQAAIGECS